MKRTTLILIPILLAAMLLCSCNADAQDGIYSAIADSTLDSGTKVKAYLGSAEDSHGEVYNYVLTDSAVIKLGSGSESFSQIQSTKDALLDDAALVSDGSNKGIYVTVHKAGSSDPSDSRLLKYDLNGNLDTTFGSKTHVKWLTTNGMYYIENESEYTLGSVSSHSERTLAKKITQVFESENHILARFEDGSINVYLNDGSTPATNGTAGIANIVGFQVIGTTAKEFLVVVKNGSSYGIHTLTIDGTNLKLSSDAVASLKSSSSSDRIQSFHHLTCATDSVDHVVFKMDNYFDQLDIAKDSTGEPKYTVTTLNTAGYASKLRTSLVVNIIADDDTGIVTIATYSNSIWQIDPTNNIDPKEIK